jgi:capsular exopolysaccharide synthesis family protein
MKNQKNKQTLISLYEKESSMATEIRRIYTGLRSAADKEKLQSVLVTSATIGEGKSITCSFLAMTAASLSKSKVALIDFDLRRPRIHDYFGIGTCPGIGEVLTGKTNIKNVSRKTSIQDLTVITSGNVTGSPSDILDQADIPGLLQELVFYFDFIVIDSPPVIPVSDPMLIAGHADGVLLVVKAGSTQREVVNRAISLLSNSGINPLGIVLNDYEDVLPYYYKDHYYGYKYWPQKPK